MKEERVEYQVPVVEIRDGNAIIRWEDRYLILRS